MGQGTDQQYLLTHQYNDGSRLSARGYLSARFSTNRYGWFRWLFDHLEVPAQGRVLELGCGLGWLWQRNMARIPAGWDITLSDFSQAMLDETRKRLETSSRAFSYAVIDAQAIPYANASFDAIIANHMLYHVPDRPKALAEIRRVLKPGGHFYASTIGSQHLRELDDLFPGRNLRYGSRFAFNLENGEEQLATAFAHVELHRYEDSLLVTEAEPLVAYLASHSSRLVDLSGERRAKVIEHIQRHIDENGAIHLTKNTGLFVAW